MAKCVDCGFDKVVCRGEHGPSRVPLGQSLLHGPWCRSDCGHIAADMYDPYDQLNDVPEWLRASWQSRDDQFVTPLAKQVVAEVLAEYQQRDTDRTFENETRPM